MAQNYKLVKKKNLGKDSETIPQKMFAIPSYNGYTDMETLCKMIGARSTVSSADVKAVLDQLELRAGYGVAGRAHRTARRVRELPSVGQQLWRGKQGGFFRKYVEKGTCALHAGQILAQYGRHAQPCSQTGRSGSRNRRWRW